MIIMITFTALYGEQLIVLQYLPHMGELIAHCRRKLTQNLEAGLVGCLALLRHIIPYMTDNTLMDQLQVSLFKVLLVFIVFSLCEAIYHAFDCSIGCYFKDNSSSCCAAFVNH